MCRVFHDMYLSLSEVLRLPRGKLIKTAVQKSMLRRGSIFQEEYSEKSPIVQVKLSSENVHDPSVHLQLSSFGN